jgi:molybdopterin/thiamine biosynthesis adenylyltransferase
MLAERRERYSRQAALPQIGWRGQERLAAATVVVVGCGGLGTVAAGLLARAGVGRLRLVDGDHVELTNLTGQVLFDEEDAQAGHPKALAAAERLRAANPTICIEPVVARLTSTNTDRLLKDAHLVLDGTDNDATRHLINRICVKRGIPWVFAAVMESYGLTMNIVPGETPCFACIFGNPGRRISGQRYEKGVLPAITHIVASFQVSQAIRLLLEDDSYSRGLLYIDAWDPLLERLAVKSPERGCRICGACVATVVKAYPKNQQRRLPHCRKPGVKARPAVFGIGTT